MAARGKVKPKGAKGKGPPVKKPSKSKQQERPSPLPSPRVRGEGEKKNAARPPTQRAARPSALPTLPTLQALPVLPAPPAAAELIVRQGFLIDATGSGLHAVPEVAMLGNAAAFEYLATVFAHLAARAKRGGGGPGEPVGLPRLKHPVNVRLSDDLDFQFALLTAENRKALLARFGVDMKSRQKGSLFERYQEVLMQFPRLAGQMRRMEEIPGAPAGG